MYRALVVLMLAFSVWSADEPEPAAGPTVLITAFKPFNQRQVNGSQTLAEHLRTTTTDLRIEVLLLEVVWGEPERQLPALVQRVRPRLILGLGEGSDVVEVERLAHNVAIGMDERDQPGAGRLLAGGPPQRRGTLVFDPAWQLSREVAVQTSDDAGGYLCNALYYTALGDLGVPVGRVGFVHLPQQKITSDADYVARFAPIVRELIKRNLQ